MPKRIEFIAPVEAIRGQLSGRQNLLYAENDNKAYEGPVGSKNYARNYTPRFVGAKIASSGKKYFSVRTKSCNHLTAKAKKAMALLGGAGALYAGILAAKGTTYANLYAQWIELTAMGETRSFRTCIMAAIRVALQSGAENVIYAGPRGAVTFKNPWYDGTMTSDAMVSDLILTKFWMELAPGAFSVTINGLTGFGNENAHDFAQIAAIPALNGVQFKIVDDLIDIPEGYEKLADLGSGYVVQSYTTPVNGEHYDAIFIKSNKRSVIGNGGVSSTPDWYELVNVEVAVNE